MQINGDFSARTRIKLREKNEGTAYDAGLMDEGKAGSMR